ncbi:MAG TPA: LysM peptidoglycan-binding domain-containing protein, partial [bacterium]|nr:LysM peptidoglycan-binding domain-containing protein [bacterium]
MPALPMPGARPAQPVSSSVLAPHAIRHVVAPGDTLWAIAVSAGVRVDALAAASGLSEISVLTIGRVLTIPASGTAASVRAAAPRVAAPHAAAPARSSSPSGSATAST